MGVSVGHYIQNGLNKIKSKDYFGAINEFRNAIKNYPNNPFHYNMIGFCQYSIRNYTSAVSYYTSAIEKTSDKYAQAELYGNRGDAKLELKDTIGAMSDYNKAIDNSKIENINANRKKLGVLYFKMNKYIEAKEIFKQIGNDSTVNPYYMKILNSYFERNDYNNTIKTCEEILGDRDPWNQKLSDPSKKPSILIIRALAYARLGKVDLEDVNLAIKLNPNYVEAYVFRGKLHLLGSKGYADKQGKIHKDDVDISSAISDFTEAIKLNPQFTEAYIARAKAKIEEAYNKTSSNSFNDIDGAMLDFDKALEISPNNVNAFIGRADLKIRLKDYKNAIIDCDNAIKLDQDSGEAYCIRGLAQVKLYRKKLGCEDFLKSLELGYNGAQEYINAYCK